MIIYKSVNNMVDYKKMVVSFFFRHEYRVLEFAGVISGLLMVLIANRFFLYSKMYFLIFFFGMLVGSLGFLIENYIKSNKRKAIEQEFRYFLQDLAREYKITKNIPQALANVNSANRSGSIGTEIERLATRVSWGESLESALEQVNRNIQSQVISHTLLLLNVFKNSDIPFHTVLSNISKEISIFKEEAKKKEYSSNIFNLAILFFIVFLFVIIYIDVIVGSNFVWVANGNEMTRVFFDNFLMYIALLLSFFTAYVMYYIKNDELINLLKYVGIFFLVIIFLFQVFVPKPDAEDVLVDTIKHMKDRSTTVAELDDIVALKSISSKYVTENTGVQMVYFITKEKLSCGVDCGEYNIFINKPVFISFKIEKSEDVVLVYYEFAQE